MFSPVCFRSETGSRTGGWNWRGRCRTPWLMPARPTWPLRLCIILSCRPTGQDLITGTTQLQPQQEQRSQVLQHTSINTAFNMALVCPASPHCPWTHTSTVASYCPLPPLSSWVPIPPISSITNTVKMAAVFAEVMCIIKWHSVKNIQLIVTRIFYEIWHNFCLNHQIVLYKVVCNI